MKPQKKHAELHNKYGHSNVTISDKEHSLPITKEYILKEYADVLEHYQDQHTILS